MAARRRLGYLPGDLRLDDHLTGAQQLDSLARLRGTVGATRRDALCERLGVVLDRPIRHLSKGNRQKIGIVQAFMHRPDLVVLDEPTSGLDPLMQVEIRALMRETADEGGTVFLSSHSLDEVQHVATRVAVIRSGRLIGVDAVERLRERALRHVTITFTEPVAADAFAALDGVRVVGAEGPVLRLSAPEAAMDSVVKAATRHTVADLAAEPADLETIFLDLYREPDGGR